MAIHVTIDLPATRAELTHFTYLACSAADDDVLFAASEDSSQLVAIPTFGRAGDLPGEDLVVGEHGDDLDDLEADTVDDDTVEVDMVKIPAVDDGER